MILESKPRKIEKPHPVVLKEEQRDTEKEAESEGQRIDTENNKRNSQWQVEWLLSGLY